MGNAPSGAVAAVQIDHPGTNYGGSNLRGRVYLEVQKPSISAYSLNIRFYGREYYRRRAQRKHVPLLTESEHFYEVKYMLCSYNGVIEQGKYVYPFEIKLPMGIPGTQRTHIHPLHYEIEYHLEVRLHIHGKNPMHGDIQNSMEVLLLDPPHNQLPTPVVCPILTVPVLNFMGCFLRSGTMSLAIKVDSNTVVASERFRVYYAVSNQSSCQVKAVVFSVHQKLKGKNLGGCSDVQVFYHRVDSPNLQTTVSQTDNSSAVIHPEERLVADSLARGEHFENIIIPKKYAASLDGKLGTISYDLKVELITNDDARNPAVYCPLVLYRTASFEGVVPVVQQQLTLPPGWQPTYTGAMVQFSLPR